MSRFPDATDTYVFAINKKGEIVGYYLDTYGGTHGFIRSRGVFTRLDSFPGGPLGINDFGEMVGTTCCAFGFLAKP